MTNSENDIFFRVVLYVRLTDMEKMCNVLSQQCSDALRPESRRLSKIASALRDMADGLKKEVEK